MKRLLVTAFEPFGGESTNASMETLGALPERIGSWQLQKQLLPVVFGLAGEQAIALAERQRPDAILCLGQAAGRRQVTPELIAVNLQYARIPDNGGNTPMDQPVIPGGREAYFATLPARRMAEAMSAAGFPAALSYSAGAYVCNDLFYRLLHRFSGQIPVDFIHVPAASDLNPAIASKAIAAAIASI